MQNYCQVEKKERIPRCGLSPHKDSKVCCFAIPCPIYQSMCAFYAVGRCLNRTAERYAKEGKRHEPN